MNLIKFTIITPVYNRIDCIQHCVECVRSQTYDNWEHIVVDDGSTDGTDLLLEKLSKGDSRLVYIKQAINQGPCSARNKALDIATGDFVIFYDSDDSLCIDALSTIFDTMMNFSGFSYYLFALDSRTDYYETHPLLNVDYCVLSYPMWITGKVGGDFVHVMSRSLWDGIRFDVKYRIYEEMTFLSLYRLSKEQFFCNKMINHIDRNRFDSVTKEACLYKKNSIQFSKEVQKKILEEHYNAFIEYGELNILTCKLRKLYFYTLMCRSYDELFWIEKKVEEIGEYVPLLYKMIKRFRMGGFLSLCVKSYSYIKHFRFISFHS
ncbi:glycosyltransferase family 2 protein [Parabacteroides goldsteinii]|uniref:glycosyltransferase family 2 protein n=1 Tax=Parabacteroides goldsteinii TaxID=328812 RepID=UPI00241D4FFD|nr:glycosyltransferase family 2 protein [Parabacteroides goldsteinii]